MSAEDCPTHRTVEDLHRLLNEVLDASASGDSPRVKALMAPLFLAEDWCCLYALAGGMMETIRGVMPPHHPSQVKGLVYHPSCEPGEVLWGEMLVAHLRGDSDQVLALFHEGMANGTVGEALAVGVVTAGGCDRMRRSALQ